MQQELHTNEMVRDHIKTLAEIDSRSKSNTKRIDNLDCIVKSIQDITVTLARLVGSIEQQGKDLTSMVHTLERHETKICGIEDKMETKETVGKIQLRISELYKMIEDSEDAAMSSKINEYEDVKKFVTKTLFGAAIFVVSSLAILGALIVVTLVKTGVIPTP